MGLNICDTSELPFKKMGHIPGHFTQNVVPSRSFIVISNPSIASQFKAQMSVSQGKIVKSKMAAEKAGSAAIHLDRWQRVVSLDKTKAADLWPREVYGIPYEF